MKNYFLTATAAFALSACGGSVEADADGDGSVSTDEMAAAVEAMGGEVKPEPGKYKTTMTFVDADIPGMPEEMKGMMGSGMNFSSEFCMTEEMANDGFQKSIEESQDDSCQVNRFNIDGSKLDMAMTCNEDGMGEMNMTMKGEVSSTRTEMDATMSGNMGGMGEGNISMSFVQERIGDCD